jgi:acylphosphatase
MPVKIRSMQTNPNGSVVVSLSFPDNELDAFLQWYSANGKKPTTRRRRLTKSRRKTATKN